MQIYYSKTALQTYKIIHTQSRTILSEKSKTGTGGFWPEHVMKRKTSILPTQEHPVEQPMALALSRPV